LLESLTASCECFLEFIERHWDKVIQCAFVFQIQPLNPERSPFVIYAQPAVDEKARHSQVELLKSLKVVCGQQQITIGAFATDGDAGSDIVHNRQSEQHVREFEKNRRYAMYGDIYTGKIPNVQDTADGGRPRGLWPDT
jgi:hypothetical protein